MSAGGTAAGTPAAEHQIDLELVSGLLADQHPDLAGLPLELIDAGWDNAMLRLGERLVVRLPRRAAAAALIVHEQRWLPQLAGRLTLPIPVPYRSGGPGRGYPWRWSVQPWLAGQAADLRPPAPDQAGPFAAFLRSLHVAAPADAPQNPVRGGPLSGRAPFAEERLRRLAERTNLITPRLMQLWETALAAPIDVPPTWLHGDLHPRNLLVENGAISGVIDWGDITSGDRATDLAAIWMLFADPGARREALAAYGELSAATLARARGWAIHFGAMLLDSGLIDTPRHALIGERTLRQVVADDQDNTMRWPARRTASADLKQGAFAMRDLLHDAAERAARYLESLDERPVFPPAAAVAGLAALDEPLPAGPSDPAETLRILDEIAGPATVASAGGRYFGFVTGGALPATLAASTLAAAWDQNTAFRVMSPAAAALEEIALGWLAELLGLPAGCAGALVTGATMANLAALAAARRSLLLRRGWDVERDGLFGAPALTVVVGDEVHVSLLKALGLLGLGRERVVRVPVDGQGRMRAAALPPLDDATILCLQAGNVNSGAFDPAGELCARAQAAGAWVHVDGAFGLWAAASPAHRGLRRGRFLGHRQP